MKVPPESPWRPGVLDIWAASECAALALLDSALDVAATALLAAYYPHIGGEPDPDHGKNPEPSAELALAKTIMTRAGHLRAALLAYRSLIKLPPPDPTRDPTAQLDDFDSATDDIPF